MKLIIREVERNWRDLKERGFRATSFSIEDKKGEILLTEDLDYERSFDIHPISCEGFRDSDYKFLSQAIISFIQPNSYLMTCGKSWQEKEKLFNILSDFLEDTGCLRVLKDEEGKDHCYKILKKL